MFGLDLCCCDDSMRAAVANRAAGGCAAGGIKGVTPLAPARSGQRCELPQLTAWHCCCCCSSE